jgi:hypothetical protein
MTAQSMEKLIYNGKEVLIYTEPLSSYLSNLKEKPKLFSLSSGCWRGYVGTWEIKDDKLYLIDFEGYTTNIYINLGIDSLFPNQTNVLAEWFTGEIRIPIGDMLDYDLNSYESTFESDLFLEFKNGQLIGQRTVNNILEEAKRIINEKKERLPEKVTLNDKKSILTKILDLLKRKKQI